MSFTVVSTLFNFYAMRRGALAVGRDTPSMLDDLRAMPRLITGFLAAVPLGIRRWWHRLEPVIRV
jgi:hypothetical protein